jgi:alpha-mannosidase
VGEEIIETTWSVSKVFKTNLLEDDGEEVPIKGGRFKVDLSPFQVATYRLVLS